MDITDCSYQHNNLINKLCFDYLNKNTNLESFYNRFPSIENFGAQITEKQNNYTNREVLVEGLKQQYSTTKLSTLASTNLELLAQPNSFTVTTGHQLVALGGPLYTLYKTISVIKLTKQLAQKYPEYNFIPVFWLASEDHDFEEIQSTYAFGSTLKIKNANSGGPVGRFSTELYSEVLKELPSIFGNTQKANQALQLIQKAFAKPTLSDAFIDLITNLFSDYGLLVIDGDNEAFKKAYLPFMKREIFEGLGETTIQQQINKLGELGYSAQVNPRPINHFYLGEKGEFRERIIANDSNFSINNTSLEFTRESLEQELVNFPERFSPNAVLRPLYQEVILPNVAYIGGAAEVAYWLELKELFNSMQVTMPIVMMRNSVTFLPAKQLRNWLSLGLKKVQLFEQNDQLLQFIVQQECNVDALQQQTEQQLLKIFELLNSRNIDMNWHLSRSIESSKQKQLKLLQSMHKKIVRAEKRKLTEQQAIIQAVKEWVYPAGSLQERKMNLFFLLIQEPEDYISLLVNELDPFNFNHSIIELA